MSDCQREIASTEQMHRWALITIGKRLAESKELKAWRPTYLTKTRKKKIESAYAIVYRKDESPVVIHKIADDIYGATNA